MPVQDVAKASTFYVQHLGFSVGYSDEDFARLLRDDAELHLWAANDESWRERPDLEGHPVRSGAESFIAGTASCRIEVDEVDTLYGEMLRAGVLHPTDQGEAVNTNWGTREFAVTDLEGNLLTFFRRL
jgi:catechol 2,3-dioxygenase-like lactoylglutathione lyase family enzyme